MRISASVFTYVFKLVVAARNVHEYLITRDQDDPNVHLKRNDLPSSDVRFYSKYMMRFFLVYKIVSHLS